jgi:hypothetical protein
MDFFGKIALSLSNQELQLSAVYCFHLLLLSVTTTTSGCSLHNDGITKICPIYYHVIE